jgi:hypothetical protein
MRKLNRLSAIILIVVLPVVLAACERELSEAEANAAISIIEPKVNDFFQGLAEDDYLLFSSEFDPYMQDSIPGSDFSEFRRDLNTTLGSYQSREVRRAVQADEFYVVEYEARFEKEDSITFGVAFHRAEPNTISHIWIESSQHSWAPEPKR